MNAPHNHQPAQTSERGVTLDAPGYDSLARVLARAFDQAAKGKGKARHANDLPFNQQPMQTLARGHGVGFLTGQACKKAEESHGLTRGHAVSELLGAINYLAGAVIFLESKPVAAANDTQEKGPYTSLKDELIRAGQCNAPTSIDLCRECRVTGEGCSQVLATIQRTVSATGQVII